MKTVLITGARGFCGLHLIKRFRAEQGCSIIGSDLPLTEPVNGLVDRYVPADLTDSGTANRMVREVRPDEVYHLGACISGADGVIHRTNLLGTVCLLDALRRHVPGARTLLVGTAAEYGKPDSQSLPLCEEYPCNPVSSYGISKHAMVLAGLDCWRKYGMKIVVARPFNILGAGVPSGLVIGEFLDRLKMLMVLTRVGQSESAMSRT